MAFFHDAVDAGTFDALRERFGVTHFEHSDGKVDSGVAASCRKEARCKAPELPAARTWEQESCLTRLAKPEGMHISNRTKMFRPEANVRFEEEGATLTAVEIVGSARRPLIVPLLRVLFGLGIIVASYQARPSGSALAERLVLQRRDGGAIGARLSEEAKAAILAEAR